MSMGRAQHLCEIRAVKEACGGLVLKVIIETCLLTQEEKVRLCRIVSAMASLVSNTLTAVVE